MISKPIKVGIKGNVRLSAIESGVSRLAVVVLFVVISLDGEGLDS